MTSGNGTRPDCSMMLTAQARRCSSLSKDQILVECSTQRRNEHSGNSGDTNIPHHAEHIVFAIGKVHDAVGQLTSFGLYIWVSRSRKCEGRFQSLSVK